MADITMCRGTDCPYKSDCYRFTATSNPWRQSYFTEIPLDNEGNCKEYWKDERIKVVRRTKHEPT